MSKAHKALSTLKRNFYGTIILGFLLPVCASEMLEVDPKTAGLVGTALIFNTQRFDAKSMSPVQ